MHVGKALERGKTTETPHNRLTTNDKSPSITPRSKADGMAVPSQVHQPVDQESGGSDVKASSCARDYARVWLQCKSLESHRRGRPVVRSRGLHCPFIDGREPATERATVMEEDSRLLKQLGKLGTEGGRH